MRYLAPYQAGIYRISKWSPHPICGGAAVTQNYIITAAHCFKGTADDPDDYVVSVGDYDVGRQVEGQQVDKIILHPDFSSSKRKAFFNDIAILKLSRTAPLRKVSPVCLPETGKILLQLPDL